MGTGPPLSEFSGLAPVDTKDKQENGGASRQTGFRPNLFISPLLSVSSLLFHCCDK